MRPSSIALMLAIGLAPACGSEPADPPDASPFASPLLVGTWRDIPNHFEPDVPLDQRSVLSLAADGTAVVTESGETSTATWVADDRTLTVAATDGEGMSHTIALDYVVTADRLMLSALFPIGAVDGTVGIWRGNEGFDATLTTLTVELRADNTAHYERQDGDATTESFDGTWAYDRDDVVIARTIGTSTTYWRFKELPGVTIGNALGERIASARDPR